MLALDYIEDLLRGATPGPAMLESLDSPVLARL